MSVTSRRALLGLPGVLREFSRGSVEPGCRIWNSAWRLKSISLSSAVLPSAPSFEPPEADCSAPRLLTVSLLKAVSIPPGEEDALPFAWSPVSLRGPLWWNTTGLSSRILSHSILEPENLRLRCWQVSVLLRPLSLARGYLSYCVYTWPFLCCHKEQRDWCFLMCPNSLSHQDTSHSGLGPHSNGLTLILLPLQKLVSIYGHIRVLWG